MTVRWYGDVFEWRSSLTDSQEISALREDIENAKVALHGREMVWPRF